MQNPGNRDGLSIFSNRTLKAFTTTSTLDLDLELNLG